MKRVRYAGQGIDVSQIVLNDDASAVVKDLRRHYLAEAVDDIKGPDLDDILARRGAVARQHNIVTSLKFPPNLAKPRLLVHAQSDSFRGFRGPMAYGIVSRENNAFDERVKRARPVDVVSPLVIATGASAVSLLAMAHADLVLAEAGQEPEAVYLEAVPHDMIVEFQGVGFDIVTHARATVALSGLSEIVLERLGERLGPHQILDIRA